MTNEEAKKILHDFIWEEEVSISNEEFIEMCEIALDAIERVERGKENDECLAV